MFFIEQFMQWLYNYPILIAMFSFTIGLICMPVVIKIAKVRHFVVKPNKRMSHKGEVPNIGGIDIFMSFILAYLLFEYDQLQNSQYIFIGVFLILMTGFVDDLLAISPGWKLFGELLAGIFLILISNIRLTNLHGFCGIHDIPLISSIFLSFFVFIVIVNSLNLIDGVDGLASGLGMIYSLFFALYFQQIGEIHLSILAYCLIGSLAVFFIYNVFGRSKRKIFMGDSGSLLLGYMMTLFVFRFCEINASHTDLGIFHSQSAPSVMIALLAVPLFDTMRVMAARIRKHQSPFTADKNHLHHLLLRIGLPHVQVTCVLLCLTVGSIAIGWSLRNLANGYLTAIIFVYCTLYTWIIWLLVKRKERKNLPQETDSKSEN